MNCAMCPSWMGGGMVRGPVLGVLLVILLLVVIAAMSGRNNDSASAAAGAALDLGGLNR